jgi:Holliday junction DNA helicase RuvA
MIGQLRGRLLDLCGREALIDVGGVGYEVECTLACIGSWQINQMVSVITYTEVREDALRLHGFADRLERAVFLLLLKVKGVGVRSAIELVSRIDKSTLLAMISEGDVRGLTAVKGLGRKTAERIVLELRDRVGEFMLHERVESSSPKGSMHSEAAEALVALGFSIDQAQSALKKLGAQESANFQDVGALVGAALQHI